MLIIKETKQILKESIIQFNKNENIGHLFSGIESIYKHLLMVESGGCEEYKNNECILIDSRHQCKHCPQRECIEISSEIFLNLTNLCKNLYNLTNPNEIMPICLSILKILDSIED